MDKKWLEKEWRLPRKNDVVTDENSVLGSVTRVEGSLNEKFVWVENSDGNEIHSEAPATLFDIVDHTIAKSFFLEKFEKQGYRKGAICTFKENENLPLEIVELDWSPLNFTLSIYLKSLTHFNSDVFVTRKPEKLKVFELYYPSYESIFSTQDSGLKWRLEVNLIEKERESWGNVGSPWEFMKKEDALAEVESWKERLKIRRVMSVVNAGWKPQLPCWSIEATVNHLRIKKVETFAGSPAYFPTAMHAAFAMKMLDINIWKRALFFSQDDIF
jgi:hypothetical protein